MDVSHRSGSDGPLDEFDIHAVRRRPGWGRSRLTGRVHFALAAGELSVAARGHTASCELALVGVGGSMTTRDLPDVTTTEPR